MARSDRVHIDLERLDKFVVALTAFNKTFETAWGNVDQRWKDLYQDWDDEMKERFQNDVGLLGWDTVRKQMTSFRNDAQTYRSFLVKLHNRLSDIYRR